MVHYNFFLGAELQEVNMFGNGFQLYCEVEEILFQPYLMLIPTEHLG